MDDRALTALKESIKVWEEKLVRFDRIGQEAEEDHSLDFLVSASACPLCRIYNTLDKRVNRIACRGCPVYNETGEQFCVGSPFEAIDDILEYNNDGEDVSLDTWNELRDLILKEIAFLKSLLPNDQT